MTTWIRALAIVVAAAIAVRQPVQPAGGALAGERPRVLVSTDIGGTDPDDFQSMVYLLFYADVLDIEGLVSSPYGPGRAAHVLEVIDEYAKDYPKLHAHSSRYPTPAALRALTKQGAIDSHGEAGIGAPTDGSRWIVAAARRPDPRPLHVLVWGGIDDLAQALHDAPDILPKLRVYFIGGPNKMWSVNAYDYIERQHPSLWMIEANSTYRGWFTGGTQTGDWSNAGFVTAHVAEGGALGRFFASKLAAIKMGDCPSVGYLLRGTPADPSQAGWGGRFVRVWDGRKQVFNRLTTAADEVEAFGVVEIALAAPAGTPANATARMIVDGRIPAVAANDAGVFRFRFSPRDAKRWPYVVESDVRGIGGLSGAFTAVMPPIERTRRASAAHPNWWTDDPDPSAAEGIHAGARSVSQWREAFLRDFAERLRWAE
jgi:hypothetical protein